ncbi:MAG: hypothetical protein AVDCRST_MAG70-888 [uncultured Thermomicrobiales bacterium]|uniref:Uncharacterized protein n=1 Tax=uncultured Thermomicrobiales bacterium TaxID=1645740 RepID=A0A6J4UIM7_9BACT|nr:MAG: hypothetical protein AVDCRST_MAG70-888 [uncultured Thermomicrobiales bacterium]
MPEVSDRPEWAIGRSVHRISLIVTHSFTTAHGIDISV